MRYKMFQNSQWFQKYKSSKLKEQKINLSMLGSPYLDGFIFCSFNFDDLYFWNHWEFRDVMYLILKVSSVVIWILKLKGVTALLPSSMPFWKRPFYSIKGLSDPDLCPCVYLVKCHTLKYHIIRKLKWLWIMLWQFYLNHYFHLHVCASIRTSFVRPSVRCKVFFSPKSLWNHPLTPGVDPQGWPWVAPGHAAPPVELECACEVGTF